MIKISEVIKDCALSKKKEENRSEKVRINPKDWKMPIPAEVRNTPVGRWRDIKRRGYRMGADEGVGVYVPTSCVTSLYLNPYLRRDIHPLLQSHLHPLISLTNSRQKGGWLDWSELR